MIELLEALEKIKPIATPEIPKELLGIGGRDPASIAAAVSTMTREDMWKTLCKLHVGYNATYGLATFTSARARHANQELERSLSRQESATMKEDFLFI